MDGLSANRIIIVDDDSSVAAAIREVADRRGLAVALASDSHQLRAIYQSFAPSLVFLDLHLPGGEDGVELLRFLAQQDRRPKLVLISGSGSKVLSTVARLAVFHGLDLLLTLEKPIAPAALEQVFAQAFGCDRLVEESDLRAALARRELTLHYQPKIDLQSSASHAIEGVEALVRWAHPKYGPLGPDQFVPLSESSGLSGELTDFVVLEAATQARRWRDMGLDLTVAVNLPAPLLDDLQLADRIEDCLRSVELPVSHLVIEVTESGVMADLAKATETLTRLRLKGMKLSMDDFGTGYSSLMQLYRLPFSELKIDRAFIIDLARSADAQIIVRSVIDLAHNLGMQVCAEGVEDSVAAETLRAWGCDRAQGFLFARPLPSAGLETLLRNQKRIAGKEDGRMAQAFGASHDEPARALDIALETRVR